jgi:hypothetical protein
MYSHQLGAGQAVFYATFWRHFEVQVRTFSLPTLFGGKSLHCGIAAREGNNVVKFNFCPGDNNDIQIDFKSTAALQPTISIIGSQYNVCCYFSLFKKKSKRE